MKSRQQTKDASKCLKIFCIVRLPCVCYLFIFLYLFLSLKYLRIHVYYQQNITSYYR